MFGAIFKVTDVMEHDLVAIEIGPGGLIHIGLPWLLVVRLKRQPPGGNEKENRQQTDLGSPARSNQGQGEERAGDKEQRQQMTFVRDWEIKPERPIGPC